MKMSDAEIWAKLACEVANVTDGHPFFVYRADLIQENSREICSALNQIAGSRADFFFSMKTNPNAEVCRLLASMGWGIDVSSERELRTALNLVEPDRIQFSGCAKEVRALRRAQSSGIHRHHIDSLDEWRWFVKNDPGHITHLSFRLSYDALLTFAKSFSVDFADHAPDAFAMKHGLSHTEALAVLSEAVSLGKRLWGLHFYLGREQYSLTRLEAALTTLAAIPQKYPSSFVDGWSLSIGPGLPGIFPQVMDGDRRHGVSIAQFSKLKVDFEIGRGLIGSAGIYGAQVLSVKKWDNGRTTVVVNGGVQHIGSSLRPLYGAELSDELPECFSLRSESDSRWALNSEMTTEEGAVFGSLCLGHDLLLAKARLPRGLKRGDWLIFYNAGAYGVTAGVPRFIHQDLPREFLLGLGGELTEVTHSHFGSSDVSASDWELGERSS